MRLLRKHVEARARERGHDLASIEPCFVSQYDDGWWEVDVDHPAYPRAVRPESGPQSIPHQPSPAPTSGPGTELKAILKDWLGIVASPNCSCNARARQMDEWGPDLCEQNLPTIVTWLEEQAKARNLPFVRFAGEQAVKLAIRRARKKAAK